MQLLHRMESGDSGICVHGVCIPRGPRELHPPTATHCPHFQAPFVGLSGDDLESAQQWRDRSPNPAFQRVTHCVGPVVAK